MFNILLDEFPTEWNGYALNTDFRIGVQMALAMTDTTLDNRDKTMVCVRLLFVNEVPPIEELEECVAWFFGGWNNDHHKKSGGGTEVVNFDADQGRIYSAFLSQYRIDLNTEDMHFWKFMHLLSNLEECAFTRVVDIRAKKLTVKMSKEEKQMYMNAKRIYAINPVDEKTEEDRLAEEEVTQQFLNLIGKK